MIIRRIDPFSLARIFGLLYAGLGLLIGAVVTLAALVGSGLAAAGEASPIPLFGLFFGVGAIVLLPILYGFFGFVGGLIWAALYNFAARIAGGVVIETETR